MCMFLISNRVLKNTQENFKLKRKTLTQTKKETDKSTFTVGDFNAPFSVLSVLLLFSYIEHRQGKGSWVS